MFLTCGDWRLDSKKSIRSALIYLICDMRCCNCLGECICSATLRFSFAGLDDFSLARSRLTSERDKLRKQTDRDTLTWSSHLLKQISFGCFCECLAEKVGRLPKRVESGLTCRTQDFQPCDDDFTAPKDPMIFVAFVGVSTFWFLFARPLTTTKASIITRWSWLFLDSSHSKPWRLSDANPGLRCRWVCDAGGDQEGRKQTKAGLKGFIVFLLACEWWFFGNIAHQVEDLWMTVVWRIGFL